MLYGGSAPLVRFCSASSSLTNLMEFWLHTKWIQHPRGSLLASVIQESSLIFSNDSFPALACWTGPLVQVFKHTASLDSYNAGDGVLVAIARFNDWLRKGAGMRSWAFNEPTSGMNRQPSTYFKIGLEKLYNLKQTQEVTVFANLKKNQRCNLLTY